MARLRGSSKCPRQFLYYNDFICKRVCEKNFKSEFHASAWFPEFQNLNVLFRKFNVQQVLKSRIKRVGSFN